MKDVVDYFGREIREGTWVIYGKRDGNGSETALYYVEKVNYEKGTLGVRKFGKGYGKGRPLEYKSKSTLFSPENTVLFPIDHVPFSAIEYIRDNK